MSTREADPSANSLRRWVFWIWVALTLVAAGYIWRLAPIATILDMNPTVLTAIIPPSLLLVGSLMFIWFVLYVMLPPQRDDGNSGGTAAGS